MYYRLWLINRESTRSPWEMEYKAGDSRPLVQPTLIYQYGTRIENQPWDDRHDDMGVNENGVDQVEVLKGPAALMVGPDALAGAIIFTDENPRPWGQLPATSTWGFHQYTGNTRPCRSEGDEQ